MVRTSDAVRRASLALAGLMLISGCGGGSVDASAPAPSPMPTPTPTPTSTNAAPHFISAATAGFPENGANPFYTAVASDGEGDAITFAIAGGADAGRFTLSAAGELAFINRPTQSAPGDADGDGVFQVTLRASDATGSATMPLSVTLTAAGDRVALHRVASGLGQVTAIAPIGSTRLLLAARDGTISQLDLASGTRTTLIRAGDGTGSVHALATGPNFGRTGKFYALYSNERGVVLQDYERDFAGSTVPSNYGPMFSFPAPRYGGGGWMGFDGSGLLLVATGDAGGRGDPDNSAQDGGSYAGKLIRVSANPDPYAGASIQPYLFTKIGIGLHQPGGGGFAGGTILLTDRGQDLADEINALVPSTAAANFGWPYAEGPFPVRSGASDGMSGPAAYYVRSAAGRYGRGIVGGAIGPVAVPSLRDRFLFADAGGAFFTVPVADLTQGAGLSGVRLRRRETDLVPDAGTLDAAVQIVTAPDGAVYILDTDGELFRVG